MKSLPRMNIHLRIQHGLLILTVSAALATGLGIAFGLTPARIGFAPWYRAHLWSGLGAAILAGYHILYLLVRGYVEGRNWSSFPLAWKKRDWRELGDRLRYILGGGASPEAGLYRASQKALYWGTWALLAGLVLSGIVIGYWEHLGSYSPLGHLGFLADLHRGLSLLLLAAALWHLYGVFTWEGAPAPQWTWLTGSMSAEMARKKVPGFHREFMEREKEHQAQISRKSADEIEEEERRLEKTDVEEDLKRGNRLAKEEKYVDALFYYRRALERYPGYSQANYNMAVVLMKMGERSMAVENFRLFVKQDPFSPLARKAQEFIAEIEEEDGP